MQAELQRCQRTLGFYLGGLLSSEVHEIVPGCQLLLHAACYEQVFHFPFLKIVLLHLCSEDDECFGTGAGIPFLQEIA